MVSDGTLNYTFVCQFFRYGWAFHAIFQLFSQNAQEKSGELDENSVLEFNIDKNSKNSVLYEIYYHQINPHYFFLNAFVLRSVVKKT